MRIFFALLLVASAACDDDVRPVPDAGGPDAGAAVCEYEEMDTGTFVPVEAGTADAAVDAAADTATPDAAVDASMDTAPPMDAPTDAPMDTATDTAPPVDAAPSMDAAPTPDASVPTSRVTDGLVLLYTFDEGEGAVVHDVSGVAPALDLVAADPGNIAWGPSALRIADSTILDNPDPAAKVVDACTASGQITIEAWVRPALVDQSGPARIFTLSENTSERNFTLGQEGSAVIVRLRTGGTSENGTPAAFTPTCSFVPRLTHVVYTYGEHGVVTIYLDGVVRAGANVGTSLDGWNPDYTLALGNEHGGERTWLGDVYLVAVYCRALTAEEVAANLEAGP